MGTLLVALPFATPAQFSPTEHQEGGPIKRFKRSPFGPWLEGLGSLQKPFTVANRTFKGKGVLPREFGAALRVDRALAVARYHRRSNASERKHEHQCTIFAPDPL